MKNYIILLIVICSAFSANAQIDKLTQSLNEYSFDLFRQVKSDKENLFISPLSTYYALSIVYEGAQNDTKQEFEKVLHLGKTGNFFNFNEFSKNLTARKDTANYIHIANAMWVQQNLTVKEHFKSKIENKYSSEIKTVDFNRNTSAANEINDWVKSNTNGLIKDIINPEQLNKYTRLVIANAIYFMGKWAEKFDKKLTESADFYAINKKTVNIDFMNKLDFIPYYEDQDIQFISKPYKGNDMSFCILLPKEKYDLADVEKTFDNSRLETILKNMNYARVKLSIPKLKLETGYSLEEPLEKLGLKKAFTDRADFSGISTEGRLGISNVTHKAFLEMDEEKTEAAAATTITMQIRGTTPMPEPKIFKADHPFTFMIVDNKTKAIIFMGRYVQPE